MAKLSHHSSLLCGVDSDSHRSVAGVPAIRSCYSCLDGLLEWFA